MIPGKILSLIFLSIQYFCKLFGDSFFFFTFFLNNFFSDERSILLFCDCSVYPFKLYVFDNTMKPFKIFLGNITNFLEPVWKIKFPKKELRCEIIQINLQNDSTNNPLLTIFYSFLFHSNLPHFFVKFKIYF
jgi:hypothetical protein